MEKCIRSKRKTNKIGYSRIGINNKVYYEHRIIYQKANPNEDISEKRIHHKCGNKWCINPKHLISVTEKEHRHIHGLSGIAKINNEKIIAKCGHLLSINKQGKRVCIVCMKNYKKEWARKYRLVSKDHINELKRIWRNKLKK